MKLATRRLIDASATLPAADRALLNLWTQRGLDNAAVAQMTGVDPAMIAERRVRIIADLSTELGLPPEDVAAALGAIAGSAAEAVADDAVVADAVVDPADAPPHPNGGPAAIDPAEPVTEATVAPAARPQVHSPASEPQAGIEPETHSDEPRAEPDVAPSDRSSRRRPVLWLAATLLAIAVIAIVVITATAGGGPGHPAAAAHLPTATNPTATSPTTTPTPATPTAPTARARTLSPLPGGIVSASGSVTSGAGSAGTQRLLVRATGLPRTGRDHYEVWLYNSIIDSVALGRLGSNGKGSFILPTKVPRFTSIDISRQPPGTIEPSGASVLRAANPLASTPH